jgi:hypothetical protein
MAKYPDLKSNLQSNYKDLLTSEVQKFVDGNYDGGGFHSFNVLSLLKHKIENLEVKALTCHEISYLKIRMDVGGRPISLSLESEPKHMKQIVSAGGLRFPCAEIW